VSTPRRPGVIRGGLRLGIGAVVLIVLLPLVGGLSSILGLLSNPFGSDRIERSETAVLHALGDLSEYRAARSELQVVVEIEDDARFVPSMISGRRTTFLAGGEVDASVDLGALGTGAVEVAHDGSVVVTLPEPRVADPRIDPSRSRVLDRDRGLLDRVGDAFTDNPGDDTELHALAETELRAAAGETDLLQLAEDNAREMVTGLLGEAGFDDVVVRFETPGAIET
jgi:hypothetical protein